MKEQRLKDLFQIWGITQTIPPLKENHSAVFRARLGGRKRREKWTYQWAAVALLCLGLLSSLSYFKPKASDEVIQFQKAEFYLMQLIEEQLNTFEDQDSPLIQEVLIRSKNQIELLQKDYHELYLKWEEQPEQPQLINALIQNLNTQINLLLDIDKTLKILNHTNHEKQSI